MEEIRLRREGEHGAPAHPPIAESDDLNADERIVVTTEEPTGPNGGGPADVPTATSQATGQHSTSGISRAQGFLWSWVQRDPIVALGAALGLGFAVGFVLRRSVLLSPWEMREVKGV